MSKTAVIHQPDFLSYLGFFHRLLSADLFIVLDCVQFVSGTNRSWTNRDKIKTEKGEKWLTIAVQKTKGLMKINEIYLSKTIDWRADNLNLITQNYKKAPFYDEIFPMVKTLYEYKCEKLHEFNLQSILLLNKMFDINIPFVMASGLDPQGTSNELLVDLLKKTGSDTYLSGIGAKDYFDPAPFEKAGIIVRWQAFTHPVYPQQYGEFIPYLSSIDLLFNCGIEKSREILRRSGK